MRNKLNPELKKDDRIVLVHMDGESLGAGIKGKVIGVENIPKFTSSDLGFQYRVEWYDENGKPFSMLSLIPETDAWIIDTDYEVESLQEIKIKDDAPEPALQISYYLQVGAFQTGEEADNMKAKLALQGFEAVVQTATTADKAIWHRVRVGPLTNLDQINKTKNDLLKNGFKADLIKVNLDNQ